MPIPAQAAINRSKAAETASALSFPNNIGDFYMSFDFYDYRTFDKLPTHGTGSSQAEASSVELTRRVFSANKQNVQNAIQTSSFAKIALPIPNNLVDSFKVEWGAEQLGLLGGIIGEAWQGGQDLLTKGVSFSQLDAGAVAGLASAAASDLNSSTATHMTRRIAAMGSPLFGQATDLALGVAENPNLVTLFRGPSLKQHQFTWKLMARNAAESETIDKIVAIFKRAMHPQKLNATTSTFLKYPAECLAEFHSPGSSNKPFLYPLRPTVVEDFSINYAPNGMPSFHQGTYAANGIEITVRLQETSYYLRDTFDDEDEYGSDGYNSSELRNTPTGSDEEENLD